MGNLLNSLLHWRSRYFRNNFILIVLIASIPGMITGLAIYYFGVGKLEQQLRDTHQTQIRESAKNIDEQFGNLEESLTYWAFDPRFGQSLTRIDYTKEFQETRDISKTLRTIRESHPYISTVELFLDRDQPILIGSYYELLKDEDTREYYQSLLKQSSSIHWNYPNDRFSKDESLNDLTITHLLPGVGQAFGAIIVTLDQSKLIQLLDAMAAYDGGGAILVKDDDDLLASSKQLGSEAFTTYVKQRVAQTGEREGSLLLEWENEKFSISFGAMDRIGDEWKFISIAPISSIIAPIIFISNLVLMLSLSGMLFGILMSWFVSSKIYLPIKKMLHVIPDSEHGTEKGKYRDEFEFIKENLSTLSRKSDTLQKQLYIHQPELRRSFLMQLSKGFTENYSEHELFYRMESYGWELANRQFQLVDLQITGIYESGKMNGNDESLITFSVYNIVEEYSRDFFEQFTVINYHDMSVGIFILTPEDAPAKMTLHYFSEGIAAIINRILDLKVTITISEPVRQVKLISQLFDEVSRGKRLRTFENMNQVIDLSDWLYKERNVNVFYPFETEKAVVQSVRRGQISEAEQGIRQFIRELKDKDVQEIHIQTGIVQLFSMIQHEIFQSGIHPSELFQRRNMVEELTGIRDVEWMVFWIRDEVISPYVRILESRIDFESKQLVEEVIDYIERHYMEDTSLEQCAEFVNTNPYILSKAFKKVLNINYIDYLTDVRITKAQELLWNTNLKISEIAEKVGYRESYFNRIFKKQVGVTASHYRKMKLSELG